MPQHKRLPRAEFQARGYRAVRTTMFSLKIKKNDGRGTRIGVVVGKNIEKTAVKRNFWKRQARAVLQANTSGDKDIIFIMAPGVRGTTRKQFRDALIKTIKNEVL